METFEFQNTIKFEQIEMFKNIKFEQIKMFKKNIKFLNELKI